ncbi:MAG: response regulator [Hyphomonadaceae bacterium]
MLAGKRILVVEDELLIALLLEELLGELGCVLAASAPNMDDAARLADAGGFDAAILDVNVGGKQVYPLAETLAARNLPIVFATGYGAGGLPQRWSGHPVAAKPYELSDLKAALEAALAAR